MIYMHLARALAFICGLLLLPFVAAKSSDETVFHGQLVIGHEVRSFTPCDSEDALWVSASPAIMQTLELAIEEFAATGPYAPVYLQAIGSHRQRVSVEGFAADYAGEIEISEVLSVAQFNTETCADANRTYVLDCADDPHSVMRTEVDRAWLFQPGGTIALPRLPGNQTETYASDDVTVSIRDSGIEVRHGTVKMTCSNDRRAAIWEHAKLNGASFRAVGNEPGWVVLIYRGEAVKIVADYGETVLDLAYTEPIEDSATRTATWILEGAQITVRGEPCADSMSDENFPVTVELVMNGRRYPGCGRALY